MLDAAVLATVEPSGSRETLRVTVADRTVTASVNAKSFRKALAAIAEHGPERIAVVLQGKFTRDGALDRILEARISVQIKGGPQKSGAEKGYPTHAAGAGLWQRASPMRRQHCDSACVAHKLM